MKITQTELTDLLKKVYEGQKLAYGDYQDCANDIAWLAMHGLISLDEMASHLPDWQLPPSQPTSIMYENETTAVLSPTFPCGSLALDLASHKAVQHGLGIVQLPYVHQPHLLIPSLVRCARRGHHAALLWHDETELATAVTIQAHHASPHYRQYKQAVSHSHLTILCSPTILPTLPDVEIVTAVSPQQLAQKYQHHLHNGLEVSQATWQQLITLSKNALVPSSEQSRQKGAGEQAV